MVERTGVVERAGSLLASARELGAPVFYTRVCFSAAGHRDMIANCPLFELVGQRQVLVDGSPRATIIPELAPQPGDVVVSHSLVAGTHGTTLIGLLRARDVTGVAITGVSTNISVEGTTRNLADAGFDVYVAADCFTSAMQEQHDASIDTLGLLTRAIVSAEEFTAALARG